jgi:rhamnosyltransferase
MMARVAVVVVLYHPQRDPLLDALRRWAAQIDLIVCVDNGGGAALRADIDAIAPGRTRHLVMPDNVGLGAAHNRGIAEAREAGCSHVVLSDQDSLPMNGMVGELLRVEAEAIEAGHSIAAVGPRCVDVDSGHSSYFVRCGMLSFRRVPCASPTGWVLADFLISSGSLIRTDALGEVGAMDETLFIDLVDTDWFLRARRTGRVAVGACGAWMEHHLGERTLLIRFLRTRTLPVHRPFRYYYMIRNSLLLYRRDYVPMSWIVPDFARLARLVLFFGVIHRRRADNLRMMVRGAIDGLRGLTGQRPVTDPPTAPR